MGLISRAFARVTYPSPATNGARHDAAPAARPNLLHGLRGFREINGFQRSPIRSNRLLPRGF
jgi:hypothetical protein